MPISEQVEASQKSPLEQELLTGSSGWAALARRILRPDLSNHQLLEAGKTRLILAASKEPSV